MDDENIFVAAVVLAAGRSVRMGQPKMVLPWGDSTVIGRVVRVLRQARIQPVVVVTGGARQQVEAVLSESEVQFVFNPRFAQDEMLVSLQAGMCTLGEDIDALLVVLGDQPQIELDTVRAILERYRLRRAPLVVPSFKMRRGHPWLVERRLWRAILDLGPDKTMRDLLNMHADQIDYIKVDTPSVLRDLDTPEDYEREHPSDKSLNR
ncbi:MAG: nucleotidyltransferase family protein [Anaerolineales bacterium]|jgi:molybdenum cofactor cytidylyltransferase